MTNDENWQGINTKDGNVNINNPNFNFGLSQRTPPANPIKYIPNRGVANFVGREQELTTLHKKLQQPGTVAISAIAGMGGIGKTELATQYALRYEKDYPGGICWLNAKSNLAAEIIKIVQLYMQEVPQKLGDRPLTLQEQVDWCWQNWQPAEKLVLVVLDDVTDENWESCQTLLPTTNRFRVLLTTRLRNLDNVQEIPLNVLPPDKALELLTLNGEKSVDAEKLCEWLGYLPLGLQLVRRYLLENPDLSLAEMLQRLQAQRLEDEAINFSTRGVKAAFELSWQQLNPITQRVGAYLSLFAPDVISWKWVESATDLLNCTLDINEAKKQLYKRYLIERLPDKQACYKIHPLIREFLKAKLAALENTDDLRRNFAAVFIKIAEEIPDTPTLEDIKSVQDAIPHLTEVAQNLTDAVSDEDLISVFSGLGRFYEEQGLYAIAEPWYKQCVEVVRASLGEEHPDVATSLNNLAYLYYSQGRYSEAEPLYIQALALRKRLLGEEHADVATSLNDLALLYKSQGRYSEAEPLYIQALALRKRLLGEEHPHVATSLNDLANLYESQGRYSDAEPLYIQALALCKRLLGEEHPHVAMILNNLAGLYYSQGRYSEAEPLYIQALALRKRLLGEEHPDVATSLNNLAYLYSDQGRYSDAEPLYIQALALSERVLGVNHPNTVTVRENLAYLRAEMSASHENVTNSSTEEKTSNSWLGRLIRFLWG
ncbi:tetratricopeptide repeat protein [Tolypothrix sp. VBCCA 56010]|uniref:tetratricopeptide repeat protein n=1 Tax=Tolypothrix sp. VBCCA 56010 TaxID=3137731 RepID=UPI003D7C5187